MQEDTSFKRLFTYSNTSQIKQTYKFTLELEGKSDATCLLNIFTCNRASHSFTHMSVSCLSNSLFSIIVSYMTQVDAYLLSSRVTISSQFRARFGSVLAQAELVRTFRIRAASTLSEDPLYIQRDLTKPLAHSDYTLFRKSPVYFSLFNTRCGLFW